MYLFIDTETTGLPDYKINNFSNVRLVQIAWILYDKSHKLVEKRDFIIRPIGYEITQESFNIHNISNKLALDAGKDINKVLIELKKIISNTTYIIAHNVEFDLNVLKNEFSKNNIYIDLHNKNFICTMTKSSDFVGIYNSNGLKWPKLSELYFKIFSKEFDESHNAVKDIEATAKCFWYLLENKIIDISKNSDKNLNYSPKKIEVNNNLNFINSSKNHCNMENKELAIRLKTYCESLKDADSISKKQMEKLFNMVDELVEILYSELDDDDDDNFPETIKVNQKVKIKPFISSYEEDDLPF
ncbi:3'-5' exonuclease [Aquirufa sp. ROCK2-A2]